MSACIAPPAQASITTPLSSTPRRRIGAPLSTNRSRVPTRTAIPIVALRSWGLGPTHASANRPDENCSQLTARDSAGRRPARTVRSALTTQQTSNSRTHSRSSPLSRPGRLREANARSSHVSASRSRGVEPSPRARRIAQSRHAEHPTVIVHQDPSIAFAGRRRDHRPLPLPNPSQRLPPPPNGG